MTTTLPKVLLVDDEAEVRNVLRESLKSDGDLYSVMTAGDGLEAMAIMEREDIALVVSDVIMPQISGIDLLDRIKRRHPDMGVILMSGYGTDEMRAKIQDLDCLRFIEKPFPIRELKQLLRENLNRRQEGFAGTLNNIQLNDIIQMCCLATSSMVIRVVQQSREGVIVISDGEIIHAKCDKQVGESAFYEIIGWERGQFETLGEPTELVVSINKGWQFLLMEAARLKDEKSQSEDVVVNAAAESPETIPADEESHDKASEAPEAAPESGSNKIRVLIVDDSPMMCKILSRLLSSSERIDIIGTAQNGEEALEKINAQKPDIITLDVNMPVMGGSTALKHIMLKNPCPVVIISSVGRKGWRNILDFLRLGAVDFIPKPSMKADMSGQEKEITRRVRQAATARVDNFRFVKAPPVITADKEAAEKNAPVWNGMEYTSPALIIVNSGIGGYAELMRLLPLLNNKMRGAVVALQTMPPEFAHPFCEYLNEHSLTPVEPLTPSIQGDHNQSVALRMGYCYVGANQLAMDFNVNAQDEYELVVKAQEASSNADGEVQKHPKDTFNHFLFSVANSFPGVIIVVLLSGAEVHNLEGLRRIKSINGWIIAQRLDTCMITEPLEKALDETLITLEASVSEIANMILTT